MFERNANAGGPRRRGSKRLDLRQNLFRIPNSYAIDLGLQWGFIGVDPVDLDASCVAMGKNGECYDAIFFNHLVAEGTSGAYMRHSGDNTTGEDFGEYDETLHFELALVPDEVHYLMVSVTSYTGADFTLVDRAMCYVRNSHNGDEIGSFQLGLVGAHTATLLCCFSRVESTSPDTPTYWDLRELGLPSSGFTFVEVMPLMQELINVPEFERDALQRMLPDYSLVKDATRKSREVVPSIMKFAIGWDGDNDLDCFLLMLNDQDEYIDHVYAKHGKLKSLDGSCLHSGDKLNGFAGSGDDEYIDIDVNRMRKDIHRVFFIVTLHSGFALSLNDVPNSYSRILNRSPTESLQEVDRYNISRLSGTFMTLIFATIVRKDAVRFEYVKLMETTNGKDYIDVLPWVRFMSMFLTDRMQLLHPPATAALQLVTSQTGSADGREGARGAAAVAGTASLETGGVVSPESSLPPPIALSVMNTSSSNHHQHQHRHSSLPAAAAAAFPQQPQPNAATTPSVGTTSLRTHLSFFSRTAPESTAQQTPTAGAGGGGVMLTASSSSHHHNNNQSGASPQATTAAPSEELRLQHLWDKDWKTVRSAFADKMYGLEIRFLRVDDLGPLEPHRFACHIECWVCDRKCKDKAKTSICNDRENVAWTESDPTSRCRLAVHRYDRVRVFVYEYSVAAYVDLEVESLGKIFEGEDVALTMPLNGYDATGTISFICRHIPLNYVKGYQDENLFERYLCSVM